MSRNKTSTKDTERPNCYRCVSFFITHEHDHPYGCRAMGFKSAGIPSRTVFESSGMECQLFTPKKK